MAVHRATLALLAAAAVLLLVALSARPARAQLPHPVAGGVTLSTALALAQSAFTAAAASEPNAPLAVVVLDAAGFPRLELVADGAAAGALQRATLLAKTALGFGAPSAAVAAYVLPGTQLFHASRHLQDTLLLGGGEALVRGSTVLGAVAVVGASSPAIDAALAHAAATYCGASGVESSLTFNCSQATPSAVLSGAPTLMAASPRLYAALTAFDVMLAQAALIGTRSGLCMLNAWGGVQAWASMDGSTFTPSDAVACGKGRAALVAGTADSNALTALRQPGVPTFTADLNSAFGNLRSFWVQGASVLTNGSGVVVGALATTGSFSSATDDNVTRTALASSTFASRVAALAGPAVITQAMAEGAAASVLTSAKALPTPVSVVVVDAGGNVRTAVSSDGMTPAGIDAARRKARSMLQLGVWNSSVADPLVRPSSNPATAGYSTLYDIAAVLDGGLVTDSGGSLLRSASGVVYGAIGVAVPPTHSTNHLDENAMVYTAAQWFASGAAAPMTLDAALGYLELALLSYVAHLGENPAQLTDVYDGQLVAVSTLLYTCRQALAARDSATAAAGGASCAALDAMGSQRVMLTLDRTPLIATSLAYDVARTAFASGLPTGYYLQMALAPNGSSFTAYNAVPDGTAPLVAVPGGMPLRAQQSFVRGVLGAVGVSSGLFATTSDYNAAVAGLTAFANAETTVLRYILHYIQHTIVVIGASVGTFIILLIIWAIVATVCCVRSRRRLRLGAGSAEARKNTLQPLL